MQENYEMVGVLFIIGLILNNYQFSLMSPETLQEITDGAYRYILTKNPILGPLKLITTFGVLATLVTGNLFAWKFYIAFLIIAVIMANVYKKKYNIVDKT